jgi:hypothetical protein
MTTPGHNDTPEQSPITLRTMGSFFFSGRVLKNDLGDTCHGDHGYAQYFIPQTARQFPLILWHGVGQSGKSWESTPDGRDGFWQIFTRRDWAVVHRRSATPWPRWPRGIGTRRDSRARSPRAAGK